ncbi:MAG: hypothetical protein ACP5QR_05220, partial [Rhizomicrobium sp.]
GFVSCISAMSGSDAPGTNLVLRILSKKAYGDQSYHRDIFVICLAPSATSYWTADRVILSV